MQIKQNGLWVNPPDNIQWRLNNQWHQSNIYTLATDSDFSGTTNGGFKYIGVEEYIEIPHVIKGVSVTNYTSMFEDNTVILGVKSTNSNVTNMSYMFRRSQTTSLLLDELDTSNVTNMSYMFIASQATSFDVSSFDTSNVTTMSNMFVNTKAPILDLSSFDVSRANVGFMFNSAQATTGYARTQEDADKLNGSLRKPAALTFVVK